MLKMRYLLTSLIRNKRCVHCFRIVRIIFFLFAIWYIYCIAFSDKTNSQEKHLRHFVKHLDLSHYISNVTLIAEPYKACRSFDIPFIVMVSSAPNNSELRDAIRRTWGQHFLTYFYMGRRDRSISNINQKVEADRYKDMVIFNFEDHYQNMTIKTGLMMQWVQQKCQEAKFLIKVDDDVLVNPWMLKHVLKSHGDDVKLIGNLQKNIRPIRDEYSRRYLPKWLYKEDVIPFYLTGVGYIINGKYLKSIVDAALTVPVINLEDIYYTYKVANKSLGFELTDDALIGRYRPQPTWVPYPRCTYWTNAIMHGFDARDMTIYWSYIRDISFSYLTGNVDVCNWFKTYVKPFTYTGIVDPQHHYY